MIYRLLKCCYHHDFNRRLLITRDMAHAGARTPHTRSVVPVAAARTHANSRRAQMPQHGDNPRRGITSTRVQHMTRREARPHHATQPSTRAKNSFVCHIHRGTSKRMWWAAGQGHADAAVPSPNERGAPRITRQLDHVGNGKGICHL